MAKTVENPFKVPVRQWRKWDDTVRNVFNRVYDFMLNNRSLVVHPEAPKSTPEQWKTIAWNAAWIAAGAAKDEMPKSIVTINHRGIEMRKDRVRSTLRQ
jgi:hypothetical protein